jgi:hypothetical protein
MRLTGSKVEKLLQRLNSVIFMQFIKIKNKRKVQNEKIFSNLI